MAVPAGAERLFPCTDVAGTPVGGLEERFERPPPAAAALPSCGDKDELRAGEHPRAARSDGGISSSPNNCMQRTPPREATSKIPWDGGNACRIATARPLLAHRAFAFGGGPEHQFLHTLCVGWWQRAGARRERGGHTGRGWRARAGDRRGPRLPASGKRGGRASSRGQSAVRVRGARHAVAARAPARRAAWLFFWARRLGRCAPARSSPRCWQGAL